MKRFIVACQITVAALFAVKLVFLAVDVLPGGSPIPNFPLDTRQAIAETTPPGPAAVRDVADDGLQSERTLLALLQERQKELDAKESQLKGEEARLMTLRTEIMGRIEEINGKIEELKSHEARLSERLDTAKTEDVKRLKELAKVYEASPPQKAAAMLEKLDIKTAAGITINMKKDKAGLVWGHLNPQRAAEITKEITRSAAQ
ncbi:MAG: hypothetical protein FWE89_03860 [Syntrophaceae bacterium]|nr:hypothetical protein [Syntrophaceae bacterium]